VIHHDQINWRLQQTRNASVLFSSVPPDGLRSSLMLTPNFGAPGHVNHPDDFM
jgi:hypothetical protein